MGILSDHESKEQRAIYCQDFEQRLIAVENRMTAFENRMTNLENRVTNLELASNDSHHS